ncbi:MAG: radical SAM protein [Blautia sp.]
MKDQYGRTIDYLRISITDACNLRCRYCMPESAAGCALEQAEQNPPLTVEEMLKIVHAAAGLGITHYRITGGGTAGKKRVRGAGAENKSSAGHRIRWDHDEWRTPGIVCEGSEGGRL